MGLRGTISLEGVPWTTRYFQTPIDYSDAFRSAKDIFDNESDSLVPVRTGYLRSSIGSQASYYSLECWADADYAEYVEYGTYKQSAQPYFEPAMADAAEECRMAAYDIYKEAQSADTQAYREMIKQEQQDAMAAMGGLGEFFGSLLANLILAFFQGFLDMITEDEDDDSGGFGANYDVDIT